MSTPKKKKTSKKTEQKNILYFAGLEADKTIMNVVNNLLQNINNRNMENAFRAESLDKARQKFGAEVVRDQIVQILDNMPLSNKPEDFKFVPALTGFSWKVYPDQNKITFELREDNNKLLMPDGDSSDIVVNCYNPRSVFIKTLKKALRRSHIKAKIKMGQIHKPGHVMIGEVGVSEDSIKPSGIIYIDIFARYDATTRILAFLETWFGPSQKTIYKYDGSDIIWEKMGD